MKKIFVLLSCLFALHSVGKADDNKPIDVDKLPVSTRQFLKAHFPDAKVAYAFVENEWPGKEYEVLFEDNIKAKFDKKGNWREVDGKTVAIPVSVVPVLIQKHVSEKHPKQRVVKIERDGKGYEIKLDNGLELKFDAKYSLTGYDH